MGAVHTLMSGECANCHSKYRFANIDLLAAFNMKCESCGKNVIQITPLTDELLNPDSDYGTLRMSDAALQFIEERHQECKKYISRIHEVDGDQARDLVVEIHEDRALLILEIKRIKAIQNQNNEQFVDQ